MMASDRRFTSRSPIFMVSALFCGHGSAAGCAARLGLAVNAGKEWGSAPGSGLPLFGEASLAAHPAAEPLRTGGAARRALLLANVVSVDPVVFVTAVLSLEEDVLVVFSRDELHAA